MKRIVLILAAAAAEVAFGFGFQSELTVGGYSGAETLVNFPVLVRLSENSPAGFRYADLQANGADMEFRSPDGQTVYPHEIDTWNTSGESLVWVRVPALSGASTKILFRYGDVTKTERPDGASVWTGAADGFYAGVWHFGEDVDATAAASAAVASDSAKHDPEVPMDATPYKRQNGNLNQMVSLAGVIGNARYNSNNATPLSQATSFIANDYSSFGLGGTFTFSGWIRNNPVATVGWPVLFGRQSDPNYNDEAGWHVGVGNKVDSLTMAGAYNKNLSTHPVVSPDITADWVHLTFVYDGVNGQAYTNGVLSKEGTFPGGAVADNGVKLAIGGSPFSTTSVASFNGAFDELRLLSKAVSADWAKAEYEAATDPSFVTAAAVGPVPNVLTITSTEGSVGTVSPAYGVLENMQDGQKVEFRATAEQEATETLRYRFTGWTLYLLEDGEWVESDSGRGTSYDYIHTAGTTAKFVWNVVRQHPLTLAAEPADGCTFTVNGVATSAGKVWVDEGRATVVAVPAGNYEVSHWTGDVSGQTTASISVDMTADAAKSATAVLTYVDPAHEPETFRWKGETGNWNDPENWDLGKIPVTGDYVYLTNRWGKTIYLDQSTPKLGKLVVDGVTLFVSNWNTRVWANEIVLSKTTVGSGGKITLPQATNAKGVMFDNGPSNRVWLTGTTLSVGAGCSIDANSGGWASHNGPCWTGIGASYSGVGAHGGWYNQPGASGHGVPYDSAEFPELPGCGAGSNANLGGGGGAVRLDFSGAVTVDGEIRADCQYGAGYAMGSGGSVWITCSSIAGSGLVTARGQANPAGNVRSGGGGRIAVHYDPSVQSNVTCGVVFSAAGGVGNPTGNAYNPYTEVRPVPTQACVSSESGDGIFFSTPGTIWFPDNQFLTLAKHRACGWNSTGVWTSPEPLAALTVAEDLTVSDARLELPPGLDVTFDGNLTVTGMARFGRHIYALRLTNSTVRVKGDLTLAGARLELDACSLTVDGRVRQVKSGYDYGTWSESSGVAWAYDGGELWVKGAETNGPGQVGALVSVTGRWTLAEHAVVRPVASRNGAPVKFVATNVEIAEGALFNAQCAGYPYGCGSGTWKKGLDEYHPTTPAPGGNDYFGGNLGGGVVWLEVENELKLNGRILADGNQYHVHRYQNSVYGGSVYLRARYLRGTTGFISACGGLGRAGSDWRTRAYDGGHIAVWTRQNEWPQALIDAVTETGAAGGAYVDTGQTPGESKPGIVHWCTIKPEGFLLFIR